MTKKDATKTSLTLSNETLRLLKLLEKAMNRPSMTNTIEELVRVEAEKRNIK